LNIRLIVKKMGVAVHRSGLDPKDQPIPVPNVRIENEAYSMSSAFAAAPVSEGSWHALKVRVGSEALAATGLGNGGYEYFAPTRREKRKYSDRIVSLEKAIFPGYIFCRFNSGAKASILGSPAVQYIVGVAGQAQTLSAVEISSIRRLVDAGAQSGPYTVGQRVRVKFGLLAGVEGVLIRHHSELELALAIELLHRSVRVRINADQVQPL
jgi:transcription termination/antitermination protein NusG